MANDEHTTATPWTASIATANPVVAKTGIPAHRFSMESSELKSSGLSRGMPQWRQRQRALPVAEKIALLGRVITETRRLEQIKASWNKSVGSLNASSKSAS